MFSVYSLCLFLCLDFFLLFAVNYSTVLVLVAFLLLIVFYVINCCVCEIGHNHSGNGSEPYIA